MKDWNFIERLNQYIDGELPREQVASLEAELRDHPEKMRIYRQYLRMDRGAEALCRGIAAESVPPRFQMDRNVIWVPRSVAPRRSWLPAWVSQAALAGGAAVAVLAIYLVPWGGGAVEAPSSRAALSIPNAENTYVISERGMLPLRASARLLREQMARTDALEGAARMEVSAEIPSIPRDLRMIPVELSRTSAAHGPAGAYSAYHGGAGTMMAVPTFTSYEFRR